jgi:putative spermidine/putrescine transport system permease protein
MAFLVAPMSFFILVQTLRAVPSVQVDAAICLGVSPQRLLSRFYLRVLRRPLILAFLFSFCWSAGFFITPRMIGGGTFDLLGNVIIEYANLGRFDYASTIALILFCVCVCPLLGLVIYATRLRKLQMGT